MPKTIRILIALIVFLFVSACLLLDAVANNTDIFELGIQAQETVPPQISENHVVPLVASPYVDVLDSELYWLARGMQEEAGEEWSDEDILKIGTVIANRKDGDQYPNTYKEVLLQEGQYEPFLGKYELRKPDDHYIYLAMRIIEGYRAFDSNVIFQALFIQGPIVDFVYDPYLGSTTYFCK